MGATSVNLSGFNEHYYFKANFGQRLESPASSFVEANPYVADENFGDAAIGYFVGRIAGAISRAHGIGNSHAAYLVVRAIESAAKSKENLQSNKRTSIRSFFELPRAIADDPERVFQFQLELYQKYFRATAALARDYDMPSAFFLQPVPAWGKVLTEDEKRVVGDLSYRDLYRRIVNEMMSLRERGLAVEDLGDVFESQTLTIYSDHIHYYSDTDGVSPGNRIVAAEIARRLAKRWGLRPRDSSSRD